ncbi:hypothetical protein KAJ27_12205, partial [bacterium]|nr:hypothetical protein [bacterium]
MIRKGIDYSYCWLQLELTDYCNLNCSMCLSGNSRKLLNIDTPHRIWADNLKHQVSFDFKTSKDFDQVYLVGDFNYWGILEDSYNLSKPTVKNIEMFKTSSGWSQEFEIATGKYRFAYLTCKNDKYEWHTSTEHPLAKDPVSDLPVSYIEIGKPKMLRRGFMSLDLIRKILDELVEKRITLNEVTPFWFGESMVHPDFIEILELLSYYNRKFTIFKRLGLHTNALLMNSSVTNQLIKVAGDFPGGLKISFSVDACTSQVYEKIRSAGTFNECIRNIKYFLQKSGNNPDILSAIQFIVQQDNFDESVEFYNYWRTFLRNNRLNYCFSDSFEYSNFENGQTVIFFRPLDNTSESRESGDMLFK